MKLIHAACKNTHLRYQVKNKYVKLTMCESNLFIKLSKQLHINILTPLTVYLNLL